MDFQYYGAMCRYILLHNSFHAPFYKKARGFRPTQNGDPESKIHKGKIQELWSYFILFFNLKTFILDAKVTGTVVLFLANVIFFANLSLLQGCQNDEAYFIEEPYL